MRELIRHILKEESSFIDHKEGYQKYDKLINKIVYLVFDEGICSFIWDVFKIGMKDRQTVVQIVLNFTPESFREMGFEKYHELRTELKNELMDYIPSLPKVYVAYDTTRCNEQLNESNNKLQQNLKQVIKDNNIFDAADMVGGVKNLKRIFKDDPEMGSLFEKLTGTITFHYPLAGDDDIEFPLKYEIINRHSNVHKTNHWPDINVFYDENKLDPEENDTFKQIIKYLVDEAQHSGFISKFEDSRLFNVNYLTVKEINGEDIDSIDEVISFDQEDVEYLLDKLYGGNRSLNESSIKEKSLIKLIEKDGLYDIIEMTGLDFNQVKSLLNQMDNPKEVLKQYIREFVLEHDGMSNGDYGSIFALNLPLSDTKYVNDILVQDSDQIAVEIWEYELDEYGDREQDEQYLTTINSLTTEELLSIISWMMETIEGGYWD